MTELVILGGGKDPAGCYAGSCFALVGSQGAYLLDCGEAAPGRMAACGVNQLSVRAVFITHMHYDHMAGLFNFLFGVWAYCRREDEVPPAIRPWSNWGRLHDEQLPKLLEVAVPQEGLQALSEFLVAMYLAPELWRFPMRLLPIRPGPFYADDWLRVAATPTSHLSSQPANQRIRLRYPWLGLECNSLICEFEGRRLVYSADLGLDGDASTDEFRPATAGADVIISEVAHVNAEYHLDMLAQTQARQIILVHVHKNLGERVDELLRRRNDRRFIRAQNGMRIAL
jgi:ribonuclease BN (tRNA processing enzyme)